MSTHVETHHHGRDGVFASLYPTPKETSQRTNTLAFIQSFAGHRPPSTHPAHSYERDPCIELKFSHPPRAPHKAALFFGSHHDCDVVIPGTNPFHFSITFDSHYRLVVDSGPDSAMQVIYAATGGYLKDYSPGPGPCRGEFRWIIGGVEHLEHARPVIRLNNHIYFMVVVSPHAYSSNERFVRAVKAFRDLKKVRTPTPPRTAWWIQVDDSGKRWNASSGEYATFDDFPGTAEALETIVKALRIVTPHPHIYRFRYSQEAAKLEFERLPTLAEYMAGHSLDDEDFHRLIRQGLETIQFLTSKKVHHGNICPYTILVDDSTGHFNIRLSDFCLMPPPDLYSKVPDGFKQYMAPEFEKSNRPTEAHDVWALGAVVYAVRYGFLGLDHRHGASHASWCKLLATAANQACMASTTHDPDTIDHMLGSAMLVLDERGRKHAKDCHDIYTRGTGSTAASASASTSTNNTMSISSLVT